MGVAAGIISAFLLQPYTIGKLGDVDVGIWMLVLSVVEYYWLIDLGLRSATVKMSAEYRALEQPDRLNELLSTGIAYSSIVAAGIIAVTLAFAPYAQKLWKTLPEIDRPVFGDLIAIASISWALGMIFNLFGACLEGYQRFDLLGRIWITTTVVRSLGVFLVLYLGHGLLAMGFVLLGAQVLSYLLTYMSFRRVVPQRTYRLASGKLFDAETNDFVWDPHLHYNRLDPLVESGAARDYRVLSAGSVGGLLLHADEDHGLCGRWHRPRWTGHNPQCDRANGEESSA